MGIQIPKYVEVQLDYPYLERPVVYKFPRLRKRDAQMDEQERALGGGRKMTSAVRLLSRLTVFSQYLERIWPRKTHWLPSL